VVTLGYHPPMPITKVGIVGSGIMGTGIAQVAAMTGHQVLVRSRSQSAADGALAGVKKALDRQIERGQATEAERDEALSRLSATTELKDLANVDLVIESVVEDLAVKLELFEELHRVCAEGTILATNTSTLPVVDIAMATGRPDKVCGVHFFNPAPAMNLVEIIRPITASPETIAAVIEFAKSCGKETVEVEDRAGFVVNALLFPYLNNAVRLFERGIASKEDIDAAMVGGCGFPMGPFALLDRVGLDTSVAILDALYDEHREQQYAPAPLLRRMVAANHLGRKSAQGFYEYQRR
jgi:3-hydroxybutyryl-CoA dehydrogenase